MDIKEVKENRKMEELSNAWQKLCKDQAIISAAVQYKKSQEIIVQKTENELTSLSYGIKLINKKVFENLNKYHEVEDEMNTLIEKYKNNLVEFGEYYDTQIASGYIKVLEEEIKQCKMYKQIYLLHEEEKTAIEKVDNSDDDIREKICNIEDEVSKSELKIRRLKPSIRKKVLEKETEMYKLLESKQQEIQKTTVKGPRIINKATRFFFGKINPYKMIQRNVFSNLKNRLDIYENSEERKNASKVNDKYKEGSILETIDEITKEETNGGENV